MSCTDTGLVCGCLAGDRRAWKILVQRYMRLIYSIGLHYGLSEDDSADVFQNVCVKLLENLEKLKDDQHLTGWLIVTTRHECARLLRQRRWQVNSPQVDIEASEDAMAALANDDPLPPELVLQWEEAQMVRRAMEDLGERCRTLLTLLYRTDPTPSYAEIAQQMNLSVGGIGPTRVRCLDQMKKILLGMGF